MLLLLAAATAAKNASSSRTRATAMGAPPRRLRIGPTAIIPSLGCDVGKKACVGVTIEMEIGVGQSLESIDRSNGERILSPRGQAAIWKKLLGSSSLSSEERKRGAGGRASGEASKRRNIGSKDNLPWCGYVNIVCFGTRGVWCVFRTRDGSLFLDPGARPPCNRSIWLVGWSLGRRASFMRSRRTTLITHNTSRRPAAAGRLSYFHWTDRTTIHSTRLHHRDSISRSERGPSSFLPCGPRKPTKGPAQPSVSTHPQP